MEIRESLKGQSLYSLIAGVVGLFALTWWFGVNHLHQLSEVLTYLTHRTTDWVPQANLGLRLTEVMAVVAIDLAISILVLIPIVLVVAGQTKGSGLDPWAMAGTPIFVVFLMIMVEELFARALFQGFLPRFLPGSSFLWAIIGNALWALVHIRNYKDPSDRHPIRALPQFVAGFLLIYLYAKYGFFWTLLAHFSFNCILFAVAKRGGGLWDEVVYGGYYLVVILIFGWLASRNGLSLGNFKPWMGGNITQLDGFGPWQYFILLVLLEAIIELALTVAGYDVVALAEGSRGFITYMLGHIVVIGLVYLGLWIGGLLGWSTTQSVIAVSVVLATMTVADSPSGASRLWFKGLVVNFALVATIITLGFWPMMKIAFGTFWVDLVPMAIRRLVGQEALEV